MKTLRASHLGMCFGVRDAIALAVAEAQRQPLTILGELVHNETVLASLRARGIRFASQPATAETDTVMVTAHGASEAAKNRARARGLHVLEATCPLVHVAHRAVQALVRDGFHPVIIGKRDHVEVRGLTEDLAECDIVLTEADVAANVTVTLKDGRVLNQRVTEFLGTPARPLTGSDLREKFRLLTQKQPAAQMQRIYDRLQNLEAEANLDWLRV